MTNRSASRETFEIEYVDKNIYSLNETTNKRIDFMYITHWFIGLYL